MSLGTAFKKRMLAVNMGNKELSEKTGIPLRTINNILGETTKAPSINIATRMAHALGCTIDDIVNDAESNTNYETIDTIAAHHDGDWTEEELDEIERFKKYIISKRGK